MYSTKGRIDALACALTDLNLIPVSAIERVEVLKDGASGTSVLGGHRLQLQIGQAIGLSCHQGARVLQHRLLKAKRAPS